MKKCDHEKCETSFCPTCGKELSVAATLLVHLRAKVKEAEAAVKREKPDPSDRHLKWLDRRKQVLKKWSGWVVFVERALEKGVR